jgi:hypothetical protein
MTEKLTARDIIKRGDCVLLQCVPKFPNLRLAAVENHNTPKARHYSSQDSEAAGKLHPKANPWDPALRIADFRKRRLR